MKLQFVSYDNIDIIKSNLKSWVDNFKQDSSDWLQDELGNALFSDTKFAEIPDFSLDMSADKPFLTEAENVKRIYGNLRFLSDSQASDERLWAGLCLGPFWDYVKYRWDINKKCTVGNVQQHFFFGFGARRSLTRNALSRLWWIGRLTYDEKRSDPWELTKFVCESSDYIMHILEIGKREDVTINLRHMMDFGKDTVFEIKIKNGGEIVHSMKELIPIASKYLNEMKQE